MRVKLLSDEAFLNTITVLRTLLKNIIKDPGEIKFHKIRLTNPKIKVAIADVIQCCLLLEMLGFEWKKIAESGIEEGYYVLNLDKF